MFLEGGRETVRYTVHIDDADGPELESAAVNGSSLTLTYDTALDETGTISPSNFTVNVNGSRRSVSSVSVSGTAVTLTLSQAVVGGQTVTVSYTVPNDANAGRIEDTSGNDAAFLADQSVTNDSAMPPLTARIIGAPSSHNGSSRFTFELRFSEQFKLSYRTLRDDAFTVTGGEVTKARRLEQGKNIRWEITVAPDGDGNVTIVLPPTTDCAATGAICAADGRKLSNRLERTVAGP